MDCIDLFIGAEGTLGIIVDATLRVLPALPALALALVPVSSEDSWLPLVDQLRRASQATWRDRDPRGIDVAAVEYLDRRCLDILREDGIDRKQRHRAAGRRPGRAARSSWSCRRAWTRPARSMRSDPRWIRPRQTRALARFCRLLDAHGVLEHTELAMPGDMRRADQLLAFREGAPAGRESARRRRQADDRCAGSKRPPPT